MIERLSGQFGTAAAVVAAAVHDLAQIDAGHRVWAHDATFWSADPAAQVRIKDRLGWLTLAAEMRAQIPALTGFATEVRRAGFKAVVVLGMGGSSLGAEVFGTDFPTAPGYPELLVLDSTDPERILLVKGGLEPRTTLYIVASKSGTTIEPLAMLQFFWPKCSR